MERKDNVIRSYSYMTAFKDNEDELCVDSMSQSGIDIIALNVLGHKIDLLSGLLWGKSPFPRITC